MEYDFDYHWRQQAIQQEPLLVLLFLENNEKEFIVQLLIVAHVSQGMENSCSRKINTTA